MNSKAEILLEEYKNKFKEFEDLKVELTAQKEDVIKKLAMVDKNLIYIQGFIKAIEELSQTDEVNE